MKKQNQFILSIIISALLNIFVISYADHNMGDDHIKKFDNTFTLRLFIEQPSLLFTINPNDDHAKDIKYRSNTFLRAGAGFSYKKLGLSFATDIYSQDEDQYGKTDYLDLRLFYYGRRFGADVFYQSYEGFYIKDPGDFNLSPEQAKVPDFSIKNIGANAYYVFNYRAFSLPAAFKQTEKQLKSAGFFLAMVSFIYNEIKTSGSLIPSSQSSYYNSDMIDFRKGRFYTLYLAPGYGYAFDLGKNFYLTPILFLGLGVQIQDYKTGADQKKDYSIPFNGNLKISILYNQETVFAGLTFIGDFNHVGFQGADFDLVSLMISIFCGIRF